MAGIEPPTLGFRVERTIPPHHRRPSTYKVFINDVAKNRGTIPEFIQSNYGQGSVFVGPRALKIGMIDEITTLDSLIKELNQSMNEKDLSTELIKEKRPDIAQHFIQEGKTQEKERIQGIEALSSSAEPSLIKRLIGDSKCTVEQAAMEILKSQRDPKKLALQQLRRQNAELNDLSGNFASDDPLGIEDDLRMAESMGIIERHSK